MATPAFFGPELHVKTTTADTQDTPSITALANGKFVVVWEDFSETGGDLQFDAVRGQLVNADGSKAGGEFLVNQTTASSQDDPVVTGLTDGRFVVAWRDQSATGGDTSQAAIRARIFNVDGTPAGDEFLVNTVTGNGQTEPAIAALTGGGFVVTWTHEFSPTDKDIRGRAYNSAGTSLGDDFAVDVNGSNDETRSAVVGLANGNYAVVWVDEGRSSDTDGSGTHIRAVIFSGDGAIVVRDFVVNTTTDGNQSDSAIALLSDGNFVVTWTSSAGGDLADIHGRVFNANGVALGPDFVVDAQAEEEFDSSVAALANGAYAVAWTNDPTATETDGSFAHVRAELLSGAVGTADAGDHVIYNKATGALFYDANGDGAGGATLFANGGAGLALSPTRIS
jgi:hypothetical protein